MQQKQGGLIRVVYAGDSAAVKVRLMANDTIEIHPLTNKPMPVKPLEFDIPKSAIAQRELNLSWTREAGLGGTAVAARSPKSG